MKKNSFALLIGRRNKEGLFLLFLLSSLEEVIDRLMVIQKIETGINHADKGTAISTIEAKKKLNIWLK